MVKAEAGLVTWAQSDRAVVSVGDRVVVCRLRGRLRQGQGRVMTGDRVRVQILDDSTGIIDDIAPRENQLSRPPIANVDQVVVVATLREPPLNPYLVDRLLVLSEHQGIRALICLNKIDLLDDAGETWSFRERFHAAGYRIIPTSASLGEGKSDLEQVLVSNVSVLAGETGVGKSSLLNLILPGAGLRTGPVDSRSGRGRHITREVRLLDLPRGGRVADSPGFMRVDTSSIPKEMVAGCFPEMRSPMEECRFRNCLHLTEPGCGVIAALEAGLIDPCRYESYRRLVQDSREREENQY